MAQSWEQLLVTRLLLGIGMGAKASVVPIFAAENSPALIRGSLVMSRWSPQYFGAVTECCILKLGNCGRHSAFYCKL